MDTTQIVTALNRMFHEEDARLVFWNDSQQEFQDAIRELDIPGVKTLMLDEVPGLEAKLHIERVDPDGKYLLYSASEEPAPEADWFLDVRLFSRDFRADRASLIVDQLGLSQQHLRTHLEQRRKFFDNKERVRKLRQLVHPEDNEHDLDLKMLAVVTQADQPELFNIIRTLYHDMANVNREGGLFDEGEPVAALENQPKAWAEIERYDLDVPLWVMIESTFGYAPEIPSLKDFLIRLMVTDLVHHLNTDTPASYVELTLDKRSWSNAVVCLDQWRDSSSKASSYDHLSAEVEQRIRIKDTLASCEIEDLIDVYTFLGVEKMIMVLLRDHVMATAETIDPEKVGDVVRRRMNGHWASASATGAQTVARQAYNAVYEAIRNAADLFALRQNHHSGFRFVDAKEMYGAYTETLYQFDQLYRHFCEHADAAESKGWDVAKQLRSVLEATYVNWFLVTFGLEWGRLIEQGHPTAMRDQWRIDDVPSQYDFFKNHVKPVTDISEKRKVYVIISDAFRFEAAHELTQQLNGTPRTQASLSTQLGVLPSYTALGMASLLPHQELSYQDGSSPAVMVDGKSTAGISARDDILNQVNGMALRAEELMAMRKDDARSALAGRQVVYIYHNVIDATGDTSSTEDQTFAAVRQTINELADLVRYISNNLNGSHVLVTADHGFLFAETVPDQTDKSALGDKPAGTVLAKKRYLLGRDLGEHGSVWHGSTLATANATGGMEYWVPKGANRFHFSGGAKFIHGGAMPQEVCVPVITIKHRRGEAGKAETETRCVPVNVLGSNHKISTSMCRFQLLQAEPIGDRVKPITLRIAIYDGATPITNTETITFDSTSESLEARQQWITLTLQDLEYDKHRPYRLILKDSETGIEHEAVDVAIHKAFNDDF